MMKLLKNITTKKKKNPLKVTLLWQIANVKILGWYPRSSHDLTLLLYLYPGDTRLFSRSSKLLLVLGAAVPFGEIK
jgi:hypothetical protein